MGCNQSELRGPPAAAAAAAALPRQTTTTTPQPQPNNNDGSNRPATSAAAAAPVTVARDDKQATTTAATATTTAAVVRRASSAAAALPPVPTTSWYAVAYAPPSHTAISAYHAAHKGRVLFATRHIPVTDSHTSSEANSELAAMMCTRVELGRDMLYGMAYLHNTALVTEHHWRSRVAHLLRVPAAAAAAERGVEGGGGGGGGRGDASSHVAATRLPRMERGDASVYQEPLVDLLLGIAVYVNDVLVPDRCRHPRSLPQCTTTLDAHDAAARWLCVPFVLVGHLQHFTLDTIALYRGLSLSFVEYVLEHMPPPAHAATRRTASSRSSSGSGGDDTDEHHDGSNKKNNKDNDDDDDDAHVEMALRVEVVYGCRAEALFCTDFIARGGCTLRLSRRTRPLLRVYAARLRALIDAAPRGSQVVPRHTHPSSSPPSSLPLSSSPRRADTRRGRHATRLSDNNNSGGSGGEAARACTSCGHPLRYVCTVCGAEVCGRRTCARRVLPGYPRGCTYHAVVQDEAGGGGSGAAAVALRDRTLYT